MSSNNDNANERSERYTWGEELDSFEIEEGDGEVLLDLEKDDVPKAEKKDEKATDENPAIERRVDLEGGLVVYIENEAGSLRKGPWGEVIMKHPYGYIAGTAGTDGDCVDVFLGPLYETAREIYVVHQGGDDPEDKLMIGFESARAARDAYLENYNKAPEDWTMEKLSSWDLPRRLAEFNGRRITSV